MRSLSAFARDFTDHHHWMAVLEHAALRCAMITTGLILMVTGLGLGVTMVMLPVGVVIGLFGVAIVAAAFDEDLPLPPDA